MEEQKPAQAKTMMMIVCFFLGVIGIHKMMMGYDNWWKRLVLGLLCSPIASILSLIDLIKIAQGKMVMADGRDLV